MKNNERDLLTISQFSTLSGITRPNLIFYDKENLLKPVKVQNNGYRMYDYKQINLAYKITTFRKMGLSLDRIRQYLNSGSDKEAIEMMNSQLEELDSQIQELEQQKYNLLVYKKCTEKYASHSEKSAFAVEYMEEEELFLSPSLEAQHGTATTMNEFLMYCRKNGIRIDCHIGRIFSDVPSLCMDKDYHMADYIFFKKIHGNYTKPAGEYLIYTNVTNGSNISELYAEILSHIRKKHLQVTGNFYEDYPLSGIFSSDREMHFIRICVMLVCKPTQKY